MNDDELLHALAEEALLDREAERDWLDERWDRLAAGELSAAGEAELRALAAESPEARDAYEAFRPLGAEFRQRMVHAVQAQAAAAAQLPATPAPPASLELPGSSEAPASEELPTTPEPPAATPPPARILPMRRRAAWFGGALAASAAVAATVALSLTAHPPLPAYELPTVTGGTAPSRGAAETAAANAPAAVYLLQPDSRLEIAARPQTAVAGSIEARWFAARQGEAPRQLPAPQREVATSGAVRLGGTVGRDLHLAPGLWSLWLVVGRPGDFPDAAILRSAAAAAPGWKARAKDWIAWQVAQLRVEAGSTGR